jgi:Zn-dependent alcohol dehydrogenase
MIVGHEGAGIVEQVGSKVSRLVVLTRMTADVEEAAIR